MYTVHIRTQIDNYTLIYFYRSSPCWPDSHPYIKLIKKYFLLKIRVAPWISRFDLKPADLYGLKGSGILEIPVKGRLILS